MSNAPTKILSLTFLLILFLSFASAADIAYVVKNTQYADDNIENQISSWGYSYNIITESQVGSTNFNNYQLILIAGPKFSNAAAIPVKTHKSLVITSDSSNIETWGIADYVNGYSVGNNFLYGKIKTVHSITENFNPLIHIKLYSQQQKIAYRLPQYSSRAQGIVNIIGMDDSSSSGSYSFIGVIPKGGKLYGGGTAGENIAYFGLTDTSAWTPETQILFGKTLEWVVGNHPPVVQDIPKISVSENELVTITVQAADADGDSLIYEIDDARFTQNGNVFIWQTNYDDAGEYTFQITVSDGKSAVAKTVEVDISNVNRAPILAPIPALQWEENDYYTINLNDYFSDLDNDELSFGIEDTSEEQNISAEYLGNGIFKFSAEENYSGEDWIVFYANDGEDITVSNIVLLKVIKTNEPPQFAGIIPNFTLTEDTPLENAFDLNDYFTDIDSELTFITPFSENIGITIADGKVSFYPKKDFTGTEEIFFSATDSIAPAVISKFPVQVTVLEQPEPLEFTLNCETQISEDTEYTCELEAINPEALPLTFSASSEQNLLCAIEDNILTYISEENYNGVASCAITVSNEHASVSQTLNANVLPINDAPEIISRSPAENAISLIEGNSKIFTIQAEDIDSDFQISWELDGVKKSSSSQYFFFQPNGIYTLKVSVSDGEFTESNSWTVIVGAVSDFTCSEISGNVCSENEICRGEILSTKDTSECCSGTCEPKFRDADSCEILSNSVNVEIDSPENSEEFELGEKITIRTDITNNLDKNQDFEVEAHLYNLDKDSSVADVSGEIEIDKSRSRIFKLDLEIPDDLDTNSNYAIFVKAKDDECSQNYIPIKIIRPEDKVIISIFNLPKTASCGEVITAKLRLENIGSDEQDVSLSLKNSALKISADESFILESFDNDDDRFTKEFTFTIPNDAEPKTYELKALFNYNGIYETLSKSIEISCDSQTTISQSDIEINPLVLNSQQSLPAQTKKPVTLPALMLLTFNLILAAVLISAYFVFLKK